jgi:hypothetical protein
MRCFICDAGLGDDDVRFNRLHQDYDPCGTCKEVIRDAVNEALDPDNAEDLGYDDGDDDVFVEETHNGG